MTVRIALFDADARDRPRFDAGLAGFDVRHVEGPFHAGRAAEAADAEVLSVFVGSRVDAAAIAALPALRLIATRSTGFDHVDVAACDARGIGVANVPSYGSNTVAEHTFGLILAVTRRIARTYHQVLGGDFGRGELEGVDLRGRTLGVVGTGRIGAHVIRIARGFSMRVLAFDVAPDDKLEGALTFEYVALDRLVAESDVVSLHLPATPATQHLFDAARLARMKRGAILVNTSRGALVDTGALVTALRDGHLGGAGLDVLEGEEDVFDEVEVLARDYDRERLERLVQTHVLLRQPNVVITPHNAFNSVEARARIVETTIANIRAHVSGARENRVGAA